MNSQECLKSPAFQEAIGASGYFCNAMLCLSGKELGCLMTNIYSTEGEAAVLWKRDEGVSNKEGLS